MFEDITSSEYPRLDKLDRDFLAQFTELINLGSDTWTVEIGGYTFEFGLLSEWEERAVLRRTSNLDALTRNKLLRVEVLTQAIISIESPQKVKHSFLQLEEKVVLRIVLLSLKPDVIDYIYGAYEWGAQKARAEIQSKLGKLEEVVSKGFFGQLGESSESLDLKTPPTPDS